MFTFLTFLTWFKLERFLSLVWIHSNCFKWIYGTIYNRIPDSSCYYLENPTSVITELSWLPLLHWLPTATSCRYFFVFLLGSGGLVNLSGLLLWDMFHQPFSDKNLQSIDVFFYLVRSIWYYHCFRCTLNHILIPLPVHKFQFITRPVDNITDITVFWWIFRNKFSLV